MHIAIVGPIATADIAHLLDDDIMFLPQGYAGAPLLSSLMRELLQRGHVVSAFTLSNDMPLIANGVKVAKGQRFNMHYCPMRPRAWQMNGRLVGRIVDLYKFERQALQNAILSQCPDVIHAHWAYEFASAALATGLPHVVTCHDSPFAIARLYSTSKPTISAYRWLRAFMAKKVLRSACQVTAVSPYMRDQVQGITHAKIVVVPNPVDAKTLELARVRKSPQSPQIAMVCNGWDARKNPKPGLIAFKLLQKNYPSAELHLYGSAFQLGQAAQTWCEANGIDRGLHFHGCVSHHTLLQKLSRHDVLLHTSLEESFGMVIAEAMAMGLPVVAGQSSGAVPWVVGNCGFLCNVLKPQDIYQALLNILMPAHYKHFSEQGSISINERFSTLVVVDSFFRFYEQAILDATTSRPATKGIA